jgi:hypothetical protein
MASNPKVTLALIVGGIVCILASIFAVAYLYHEHAATFTAPRQGGAFDNFDMFAISIGIPSAIGIATGIVLLAIGIKKDGAS